MSARLPPALLVLVASLTLAQLPRSSPAPTPTFVPYPRSLHLLDAVEGTRGDEPRAADGLPGSVGRGAGLRSARQ